MKKPVTIMVLFFFGFVLIGARGDGNGCGGMMDSSHMNNEHGCCGDENNGQDSGIPPLPNGPSPPEEQYFLRVTLDEADAELTSDLYLSAVPPDLLFKDTPASVGESVERNYDGNGELVFFLEVQADEGPYIVTSDSEWAETSEINENKWIIGFEDVLFEERSDFDYNDAVIVVEAVNCE